MVHVAKHTERLKALRFPEILLMTGFSFVGILFTNIQGWTNPVRIAVVCVFVLFYVMAVYFLNSFAGYKEDIQSQRLKNISLFSKSEYAKLFILFSSLFIIAGLYLRKEVLAFAIVALLLWAVYYLPPLRLKSTMLMGTVVHFWAGVLHFHTGFCSFDSVSRKSIVISVFYALLLCVGHLHHEIIDYSTDKNAGNRTTAVRIGVHKMYILRSVLAAFTLFYWITVYGIGYITIVEFLLFGIPSAILLVASLLLKNDKTSTKYQTTSRCLFLTAGTVMFVIKLWQLI